MLAATFLFASIEAMFFAAGKVLERKWGMWRAAEPAADYPRSFESYMEVRNPIFGWPYPMQYGDSLAKNGALVNTHYLDAPLEKACISLYGDSFTEGGDISSPDKRWSDLLSASLNCYVANFAMGGHGTDQAYLRFETRADDKAPLTILGFHTADVTRNLTRIRDLEIYAQHFALKPRFVLNQEGDIDLVPIPILTYDEYLRAVGAKKPFLNIEHETMQPGGPSGAVALTFPYSLAVIKNALFYYRFRARVGRYPEWMPFLQEGHPMHGLEITAGISRKFAELAESRGKKSLILILPHPEDFIYYQRTKVWTYSALVERHKKDGLAMADFGPYLIARAEERKMPLQAFFGPTQHYNDEGNAEVARFVLSVMGSRP
ncbi:MAG TPA: hypothetical protein PKC60_02130 [Hydrogenophaga sp.]|uniref:hypothetical protein n=1 Tax=Hydrogenophaga sp. TaxID=1904254 RepID=UPI002BC4ACA3|nr:hypothetical protein [Hydrogenophaga sp.]HMN92004.1 hypothetical protein [Hydrogenophaga sp.]HMP08806.1 hypothetical protein [Hydrogenophaga sp.]